MSEGRLMLSSAEFRNEEDAMLWAEFLQEVEDNCSWVVVLEMPDGRYCVKGCAVVDQSVPVPRWPHDHRVVYSWPQGIVAA